MSDFPYENNNTNHNNHTTDLSNIVNPSKSTKNLDIKHSNDQSQSNKFQINKESKNLCESNNNSKQVMNDMIDNDHPHPINSDKPTVIFCKEREKLFSVFLQHFLFRDKSANIINSLLDKIELKHIESGKYLFKEGDKPDNFYIVKEGAFEIFKESKPDDKKPLGPFDTFGELALIESKKRTQSVKCVESGILYFLEGKIFKEMVNKVSQKELKERLSFISLIPLFASMEPIHLNTLALSMNKFDFAIGDNIINEGDMGDSLYIILEGEVNCVKEQKVQRILKQKDFFGEYAVLFDIPRTMSIYAKTKVSCYHISKSVLEDNLGADYRNVILKSIIKEAFKRSTVLNIFENDTYINMLFQVSQIKEYENESVVITPNKDGSDNDYSGMKLIIIIAGNFYTIENKNVQVIAKRGQLFGEQFLKTKTSLKTPVLAQGKCRVVEFYCRNLIDILGVTTLKPQKYFSFFSQLNYMKKTELFRNTSDSLIIKICLLMSKEKFSPKSIIMNEGEMGDKFYLIKNGKVIVKKHNKLVREMEQGSCFGEMALLVNEPRSATVEASTNVTTYVLTKQSFIDTLDKNMLTYLKKKVALQDTFDSHLEDFFFCKNLGQGKFGSVSLVHNGKNYYALKAVSRIAAEKQKILIKYFLEERRVLIKLDHPFIMKLVRTFKNDENVFFLTEFINGRGLGKYLESKPQNSFLNKYETQFYVAFLLIILDYINSKQVIHRDLKPDNIMIDSNGYLKIIDFGTAITIKNFTSTITGTPHYIGPEVLMGKGYSYSCDYWSVGVITHELFYNYYPFGNNAGDPMEVYRDVLKRELTLPSKGDPVVNSFIKCLLRKKVNERLCNFDKAKKHPFYKDFHWGDLIDFRLVPPYIPKNVFNQEVSSFKMKYIDFLKDETRVKKNKNSESLLSSYDDDGTLTYNKDWVNEF